MPLFDIDASAAVEARKNNPFATWGDRSKLNRVEPVTKPAFDAPFQLERGESVFTVGSCFARNVEIELMKYGFRVPMRELFKRPEFAGMDAGIVNNFGTPSIYNEFAWALGEQPFVPEDHIVEVLDGKFADVHVIPSVRPEGWEKVLARRTAITEAFRTVKDCRVCIMTLGLVEVWYDTKTGAYLNATPRPTMLRQDPDRYRLHVLSYAEVYKYLNDALLLLRQHGRKDLHVILTVSPVPLTVTHRQQDVIVANTYSKSVLRAAAEQAVAEYDFVTYFPSFESVILSDRKIAWRDDMVHVTDAIVAINVGRMIDTFVPTETEASSYRTAIAVGGEVVAVEWAQKMRRDGLEEASGFFKEYKDLGATSADFALEYIGHLVDIEDYAAALAAAETALTKHDDPRLTIAMADMKLKVGDPEEAFALLSPLASPKERSAAIWNSLLGAAKAIGDPDRVIDVMNRYAAAAPRRAARTRALVGRWFQTRRDLDTALTLLEQAVGMSDDDQTARLYYIDALLTVGRVDDARENMSKVRPITPTENLQTERLKRRLESMNAVKESAA